MGRLDRSSSIAMWLCDAEKWAATALCVTGNWRLFYSVGQFPPDLWASSSVAGSTKEEVIAVISNV
jgi:hypothetical protein